MNEEPEKPKENLAQKPLRTYEGDIAEALYKKQGSVASIAIAEAKRDQEKEQQQRQSGQPMVAEPGTGHGKQIAFLIISIILIGGGVYGGYYLYKKSVLALPTPVPQPIVIKSLVPVDKQVNLDIDANLNSSVTKIYSKIRATELSPGKIAEIVLSDTSGRISGTSFLKMLAGDIPDVLLRSMTDKWMLGAYTEEDHRSTVFISLTTDFFQNAFAGMLQWENHMPDDLASILKYQNGSNARGKFVDKIIKNRDVREYVDTDDQTLFLYAFIDKNTFVITTTESSLSAIISRIEKQIYIR